MFHKFLPNGIGPAKSGPSPVSSSISSTLFSALPLASTPASSASKRLARSSKAVRAARDPPRNAGKFHDVYIMYMGVSINKGTQSRNG